MTKPIIRVLLLSKYEALGASSRLRALQFLPHLASQGFNVDVVPFLDNSYIESVQFGRRAFRSIVSGYVRRIASLLMRKRYDLVWVEKDFLPWVPKAVEDMLLDSTVNYVVDYDDAVFHQYDMHEHAWVRRLLATKIDLTMRNAAVVIAGNSYLAQRAIAAGARRVEIVPTVVDVGRYITSSEPTGAPFCVGWIGQGSTVQYLKLIEPTLRALY